MEHDHRHADHADHADHAESDASVAAILDLDAEVTGTLLDDLTAWAAGHTEATPRRVLDVGAGTGTGTFALARRFPAAELIALDRSPTMLGRLRTSASAAEPNAADRLRTVQADLDAAPWPASEIGTVDLAWAALSLHHFAAPDRVLADLRAALNPGGLLVVVEMDAMPRFLPEGVRPGLEDRCREAAARNGWNAWPNWTGPLERAGFRVAEERTLVVEVTPAPPAANDLALRITSRMRERLADQLSADDLAALDVLLDPAGEEFVGRRGDLVVRSTRTVWAAHRP